LCEDNGITFITKSNGIFYVSIYRRSGCAITILGATALPSYNPGVIPQRWHAVYMDIAEAHGTQRNETRPTFNGSKISPSNASIRVWRWRWRGERVVGFIRHSAEYTSACTGACRVCAGRFNQIYAAGAARKGAAGRAERYWNGHRSPPSSLGVHISLVQQLKNMKRRRSACVKMALFCKFQVSQCNFYLHLQ